MLIFPAFLLGASGGAFGFRGSAITATNQITVPSNAGVNNLAVIFNWALNDSGDPCNPATTPPTVIPSGWSVPTGSNTTGNDGPGARFARLTSCYKKLTSGDLNQTLTIMSGTPESDAVMVVFGTGSNSPTLTASTFTSQITSSNPTLQSVVATGQTPPLVVLGCACAGDGSAAFSTASPAFTATIQSTTGNMIVGYTTYAASPATTSIDMNDLGALNGLTSGYIRIS